MAKKDKQDPAAPIRVLLAEQVEYINWGEPEKYDFFDTPREVREHLVPAYLSWAYENYRREMYDKFKKNISQNHYAMKTIGIDAQSFSLYKSGTRFPSMPNADILAAYFGALFYDICGYARRMPHEKSLYKLSDIWPQLEDKEKAELLERANNYRDNKDVKNGMQVLVEA